MLRRGLQVGREHGFKHFLGWLPVVMSRICALALDEGIEVDYVQFLIRERGLTPPADGRGRSRWPWPMAIRTFGDFRVEQRSAGGAPLSGKPLGLLKAMVGCNGGNRIDEGELAALLWPRKDVEYARRSLTTTLHRLRKVIGDDRAVVLRHGRLSIARDLCRVDLDALDEVFIDIEALYGPHTSADTAVALAAKVLDVYQGPFMDGEAQAEFVTVRERVRNRVLGALDQLARVCESAGAPQRAPCTPNQVHVGTPKSAPTHLPPQRRALPHELGYPPAGRHPTIVPPTTCARGDNQTLARAHCLGGPKPKRWPWPPRP